MARVRQISNIDPTLINELAMRFNFEADALENEMKEICKAILIEDIKADQIPSAKERKDELDSLDGHAGNLRFLLTTMPGETRREIALELDSGTDPNGEPGKAFYGFINYLDALSEAAEAISDKPVARKENPARQSQLCNQSNLKIMDKDVRAHCNLHYRLV